MTALSAPAALLHAFCTMALKPRSPSMTPNWAKAYGMFMRAGESRDALDDAIIELGDAGIFTDDFPTELACRADLGGRLPQNEWAALRAATFERDGYVCTYCGSGENLECDHVQPVSRGGSNDPENLTTACRPCNRSKADKTLQEWRQ